MWNNAKKFGSWQNGFDDGTWVYVASNGTRVEFFDRSGQATATEMRLFAFAVEHTLESVAKAGQ